MADWESMEARARTLYPELMRTSREGVTAAVAGYDAATVGAATLLLIRRMVTKGVLYRVIGAVSELSRRQCEVTPAELLLAAEAVTTAPSHWQLDDAAKALVRIMARSLEQPVTDPDMAEAIRALAASVSDSAAIYASTRSTLRAKLLALLPPAEGTGVDTTPIAPDAWAVAVRPYLDGITAGATDVTALIRHLATATGSKPGKGWLAKAGALLAEPAAQDALRFLVDRLADTAKPTEPNYASVLGQANEPFARALIWALLALPDTPSVALVQHIVVRGMAGEYGGWSAIHRVPNAGILVLGRLATPEAIAALQHLSDTATNNGYRKSVKAALAEAAASNGLQPGQLVERNIPDAGLAADGTADLAAGGVRARARLGDDLKVTLEWHDGDTLTAKPPADVDTSDVNAVKRQAKEIRDAVGAERGRLEGLLAVGREWTVADWRRYYLDHPVTGRIARHLLWTVTTGTERHTGLPSGEKLSTLDGEIAVPETGTVVLWHPATAATDEVAAWRTWLVDNSQQQPFKQAYREVYLLTPAEVETGTYSNRFAAHILRYPQLYALFKERGWTSNFLGPYYGGSDGIAHRDLTDTGLTVVFEHQHVEAADRGPVAICGTDRVWFFRTGDRGKRQVPLGEVPPLVFSEAMRDVDLFVAVTTIAADPDWVDRGDHPYRDYWTRTASADLTATAQVRREALARILPRLAIADRLELGDRHLRVRGELATYKIHIGSANILIEPDDRYLCIVPKRSRTAVMLPFDGDDLLSQILSKALLLAADHRIKDPAITSQLPHRRYHGCSQQRNASEPQRSTRRTRGHRVTGYPGFDVLLARLSAHRQLDAGALSQAAGVLEADVQAVFDGGAPSPSLLRQLAPALKLHTADLFVIAGVAVPDELTPLDARAGRKAETLVRYAMGRSPEQRQRLLQFVRSLRQESRPQPVPPAPGYQRYEPSYGALLVRMLHNRNLGWVDASKVLFCLGRVGPWSAATVGVMGRGLKELTPELLIGFATVLGIPADDLAALIDIELPDDVPPPKPGAADAAELLWEAGRLTADQVQQAIELAKAMRRT